MFLINGLVQTPHPTTTNLVWKVGLTDLRGAFSEDMDVFYSHTT